MKFGGQHVIGALILIAVGVVLGNWIYKKLNLG